MHEFSYAAPDSLAAALAVLAKNGARARVLAGGTDLIVAMRVVEDIDEAVAHVCRHGSNHTDAIVSEDPARQDAFIGGVTSSCVLTNASTRFNDGFQLGLGAEIGISTSKIHAYGPMGLEELTTQRFVVRGAGQTR